MLQFDTWKLTLDIVTAYNTDNTHHAFSNKLRRGLVVDLHQAQVPANAMQCIISVGKQARSCVNVDGPCLLSMLQLQPRCRDVWNDVGCSLVQIVATAATSHAIQTNTSQCNIIHRLTQCLHYAQKNTPRCDPAVILAQHHDHHRREVHWEDLMLN